MSIDDRLRLGQKPGKVAISDEVADCVEELRWRKKSRPDSDHPDMMSVRLWKTSFTFIRIRLALNDGHWSVYERAEDRTSVLHYQQSDGTWLKMDATREIRGGLGRLGSTLICPTQQ